MKNQITSRDYELISAYLDNQLGTRERAILEARLNAESELRKELHEISKTRSLIRSLPKLRAPRNYFISEKVSAKVKVKPTGAYRTLRLSPALGIVSAIATILLVLVIYGDSRLTSTTPVVMVPANLPQNETLAVQQEVQRLPGSPSAPTEEAPAIQMAAPALASPTPPTSSLKVGQSGIASPTTIYIYTSLPTSTPGYPRSVFEEQTQVAVACEDYYRIGVYPVLPYTYYCPTPTQTISEFLLGILPTSTPTPSATPTPEPSPTLLPPVLLPPIPMESPSTEISSAVGNAPADQTTSSGIATPSGMESTERPGTAQNADFMRYLMFGIEFGLAAIAIIAGVIAVILRLRTGR